MAGIAPGVQLWLSVPIEEKERVKNLGARWHAIERRWFVPHGADVMPFRAWWPDHLRREYRELERASASKDASAAKKSKRRRAERSSP